MTQHPRIGRIAAVGFRGEKLRCVAGSHAAEHAAHQHNPEELQETESRESSLEQQQVFLEAQLVQLKPDSAVFDDTGQRVFSTPDRLKMLRSELAADRATYGAAYPDIERLSREVAGLEATEKTRPISTTCGAVSRTRKPSWRRPRSATDRLIRIACGSSVRSSHTSRTSPPRPRPPRRKSLLRPRDL